MDKIENVEWIDPKDIDLPFLTIQMFGGKRDDEISKISMPANVNYAPKELFGHTAHVIACALSKYISEKTELTRQELVQIQEDIYEDVKYGVYKNDLKIWLMKNNDWDTLKTQKSLNKDLILENMHLTQKQQNCCSECGERILERKRELSREM